MLGNSLVRLQSPPRIVTRGYRKPVRPVLIPGHPLNKGLAGCWLLGDVGGTGSPITRDISGFNNNGTLVNGPTLAASHHGGLALAFDGSTNYVTAPDKPFLQLSSVFSISAWVYPTASNDGNYHFIVGKVKYSDVTGANSTYKLYLKIDGTIGLFNSSTALFAVSGVTVLPVNKWTHVASTSDGVNCKIFINGLQDAAAAYSTSFAHGTSADPIQFGINKSDAPQGFAGRIELGKIDNRARAASEWAWLYAEPYAGIADFRPDWRVGAANTPSASALWSGQGNFVPTGLGYSPTSVGWTGQGDFIPIDKWLNSQSAQWNGRGDFVPAGQSGVAASVAFDGEGDFFPADASTAKVSAAFDGEGDFFPVNGSLNPRNVAWDGSGIFIPFTLTPGQSFCTFTGQGDFIPASSSKRAASAVFSGEGDFVPDLARNTASAVFTGRGDFLPASGGGSKLMMIGVGP